MAEQEQSHWLARYGNNYHDWSQISLNGKNVFKRPLGLVESSFDIDGTEYGGRADMNALFTLEIRSTLSKTQLRERVTLVWANLRLQHVMLQSRIHVDERSKRREFVIDIYDSLEEILEETAKSIIWIEDLYPEVDVEELYKHCLNVGRIIDPSQCLSRLHVLPLTRLPSGTCRLQFLIIMAHQISDGLSAYNWFSHFLSILNKPPSEIVSQISTSISASSLTPKLPPAQESLYPLPARSLPLQRWFWTILRILRHTKKPLPPSFPNPLRRPTRKKPISLPPTYPLLFNYAPTTAPPQNTYHITATLSPFASTRLLHLCRSINVTVGAGCFALAGLSMMELEEARYPHIPDAQRAAFTASFPLNPRAFFNRKIGAESCMLAFSEGIVMPFLPSSLPFEGRFRLTARHANRELKMYQKRRGGAGGDMGLAKHAPGRVLANAYLGMLERVASKSPSPEFAQINPQGDFPASGEPFGATCGVSSVGSTAGFFREGMFDLREEGGFKADYRGLRMGVRARENEFLVGSSTGADGVVGFGVSFDGCAVSEEAARVWKRKIEGLLEGGGVGVKL